MKELEDLVNQQLNDEIEETSASDVNPNPDVYIEIANNDIDISPGCKLVKTSIETDWDLMVRDKRGTDRTNNLVIGMLEGLRLEAPIFNKALSYYRETIAGCTSKVKFKNAIMCASVFVVCGTKGEEAHLISHFGTTKTKYTKALVMVKKTIVEARGVRKRVDNELYTICVEFGIESEMDKINAYMDTLEADDLMSEKTRKCTLLYIWMFLNKNIIPDTQKFSKVCGISWKTISRLIYRYRCLIEGHVKAIVKESIGKFVDHYNEEPVPDEIITLLTRHYIKIDLCKLNEVKQVVI